MVVGVVFISGGGEGVSLWEFVGENKDGDKQECKCDSDPGKILCCEAGKG